MAGLSPTPKQQIFGADGAPLVGGKIYTYAAGTTTPTATYTSSSAGTANTNPIILDSYGQANIWLLSTVSYKFVVKTATDVLLYTVDNIATPLDISALAAPPPIGSTTPNTGAFTTLTASGAFTLTGSGAMLLNAGTTGDRPTPSNGMIRYNTTTAAVEGYIGSAWKSIVSGTAVSSVATGTGLTGGPITSTGTIAIDSTVVTLTGTQTLSNKTIQGGVINAGTAVAATGTSVDFTSVPSWAKRITLIFSGIGTNGTSIPQLQIGPSSAVETSGYLGSTQLGGSSLNYSSGFLFSNSWASTVLVSGTIVLQQLSSSTNNWVATIIFGRSDIAENINGGGGKIISGGALSRMKIGAVNGTDTFTAGYINVFYE